MKLTLNSAMLAAAVAAASACNGNPGGGAHAPATATPATALTDAASAAAVTDTPPSGAFQNLAEISVVADPRSGWVVIAAPPGSWVAGGTGAEIAAWEAGSPSLAPRLVAETGRLIVPADLRATVDGEADGSFVAEFALTHRGFVLLSTKAAASADGVLVGQGGDLEIAYKDPFGEEPLQPLRQAADER